MCIRDSSPSKAHEPVSEANLRFHCVLSITIPSEISSSIAIIRCLLKESSTVSLHLFRGLPLGLTPSGLHLHLLLATLSSCILSRCPHHLSLAASTLFIMGFTPTLSLTVSFLTLSLLVFPITVLNTFISAV